MQSGMPLALAARMRSMMSSSAVIFIKPSKAGKLGMRQAPAAHQLLAVFGAALQRRNHLARVEHAGRIEGALDAEHLLVLRRAELHAHAVELLHADAMLARDRAAHGDAGLQDV